MAEDPVSAEAPPAVAQRYASPEQCAHRDMDVRSDIYSLGASLYYLGTGRAPFEDALPSDLAARHARAHIPWPSEVNTAISDRTSRVIARMMAKDPAERYKTPAELVLDFNIIASAQEPVIAAHAPSASTIAPSRHPGGGEDGAVDRAPGLERRASSSARVKRAAAAEEARAVGTARRPSVRARHASTRSTGPAEPAVAGPSTKVLAVAAGGIIAAIIGILLVVFADPGTDERAPASAPHPPYAPVVPVPVVPVPAPVKPEPVPPAALEGQERRAREALEASKRFLEGHPDAFPQVMTKLSEARDAARGTSVAARVEELAEAVRARWDAAALGALERAERKARKLASAGDYEAAMDAVASIDQALAGRIVGRLARASNRISEEARRAIDAACTKADEAVKRGESASVRAALEELKGIRFARERGKLDAKMQALVAAMAVLEQDAERLAAQEARDALAPILEEFDRKLDADDCAAAGDAVNAHAARPELAPVREELLAAARLASCLADRREAALEAVRQRVGDTFSVSTTKGLRRGTLQSVDESGLTIVTKMIINGEVRGETAYRIRWRELAPAEEDRLTKSWSPKGPEGELARAVLALRRGDVAGATRALAMSKGSPLEPHYARRIEVFTRGAAEAAAKAAWDEIRRRAEPPRLSTSDGESLLRRIDAFEDEHGRTECGKAVVFELARFRDKAAGAALGVGPGGKARVTLGASDDTYLDGQRADEYFGGESALATTSGTYILVRFDCTRIPRSARVVRAVVSLHPLRGTPAEAAGTTITAHALAAGNAEWKEAAGGAPPGGAGPTLRALCAARADARSWASGGSFGSKPGVDFATAAAGTRTLRIDLDRRLTIALRPAVVQAWVNDPAARAGLVLATKNTHLVRFASKEHPIPAFRPQLIVEVLADASAAPAPAPGAEAGARALARTTAEINKLLTTAKWRTATWSDPARATVTKQGALTIEVPGGGTKDDKITVGCACRLDLTPVSRLTIMIANYGRTTIELGIAIVGSKGYYESRSQLCAPRKKAQLSIDLKGMGFKTAQTEWEFGTPLAGHEAVKGLHFVIYSSKQPALVQVRGIRAE
jgi:hypothetical protein